MTIDKTFAAYALILAAGTACVLTLAVTAGGGSFPPAVYMIEHLILALSIRAAYKSFDGPVWFPYRSQFQDTNEAVETNAIPDSAAGALG
jgi:hypothetical protein